MRAKASRWHPPVPMAASPPGPLAPAERAGVVPVGADVRWRAGRASGGTSGAFV